ncbi:arginase family protein [Actinoplanes hulinensis]|uniref:arginase family protein n=1 Tax=Actinoplanes hulinensis TaxID=1144547 RepID=UPI0027E309E6|nr:arginase family protein [Actinoplanes hulinensis]
MRRIAVLDAPSNLGLRPPTATSVPGCAKAPGALRDQGLLTRLAARDAGCLTPPRYDPGDWRPGDGVAHAAEIAAYSRALADRIGAIIDGGEFPVVLGGDCSILIGSGIAMHRLGDAVGGRIGLVFVDGHSDFRHPGNASYVGAAAGEDLALVTGRGQANLAAIESRRPYFRDIDVVVLGIRAQDEYRLDLQAAGIVTRPVPALRAEGAARSAQWARDQLVDCAGYWVHVDVDVLDPAVMPAVDAPDPGGIAFPELELLLAGLVESPHCLGVEITVFDPDYDPDGRYAAEITSAVVSGLSPVRATTPRPDLVAARRDLATTTTTPDLRAPGSDPTALVAPDLKAPGSDPAALVAPDLKAPGSDPAALVAPDLKAPGSDPTAPVAPDIEGVGSDQAASAAPDTEAVGDAGTSARDAGAVPLTSGTPLQREAGATVRTGTKPSEVATTGAPADEPSRTAAGERPGSATTGDSAGGTSFAEAAPGAGPGPEASAGGAPAGEASAKAEAGVAPTVDPTGGASAGEPGSGAASGEAGTADSAGGTAFGEAPVSTGSGPVAAAAGSGPVAPASGSGTADPGVGASFGETAVEAGAGAAARGAIPVQVGPSSSGDAATESDRGGSASARPVKNTLPVDAEFVLAAALGTSRSGNGRRTAGIGDDARTAHDRFGSAPASSDATGSDAVTGDEVSRGGDESGDGPGMDTDPDRSDPENSGHTDRDLADRDLADRDLADRDRADRDRADRDHADRDRADPESADPGDAEPDGSDPEETEPEATAEPADQETVPVRAKPDTRPGSNEVRLLSRLLGSAPLLDSEPIPATRPGMLRPRPPADPPVVGDFGPPTAGPGPLDGLPPGAA